MHHWAYVLKHVKHKGYLNIICDSQLCDYFVEDRKVTLPCLKYIYSVYTTTQQNNIYFHEDNTMHI